MKTTIKNVYTFIRNFLHSAKRDRKKQVFLFIVLIGFLLILRNTVSNNAVAERTEERVRQVELATLSTLAGLGDSLVITGTVESQSEANIRAEGQGQVARVNNVLGDYVTAGQVIAEIENALERAQVAQAQASVDSAIAQRDESSSLTSIRLENSQVALEEEKVSAVNTITSAFTLVENALFGKADQFFSNPRTSAPVLKISSFGMDDLDDRRATIGDSLIVWNKAINSLSPDQDLIVALEDAESRLQFVSSFMRDLSQIVTRQGSSTEVTDILSARTSIDTALSNVSTARDQLQSAKTSVKLAREENSQASGNGISTRDAAVRQAQAGLKLAQASLEKKIIRAPLSGTINSLPIAVGDVVSPGEPVAVVANNSALRVKTYITEVEKDSIRVGQTVRLGASEGVITAISPALDPVTRKIEVIIGVKDTDTDLVNGQSIRVVFDREGTLTTVDPTKGVRIPISAINIGVENTVVFGVNEDNVLVPYPVKVGPIFGDSVLIFGELDPQSPIVVDARGLRAGQNVTVRE